MRNTSIFSNIGASPSSGFNQGLTLIPLEIVCGIMIGAGDAETGHGGVAGGTFFAASVAGDRPGQRGAGKYLADQWPVF
ncbi:hypothetical protein RV134_270305 [Roseovarius sp. EC-HK134]|nr:hypothetical protein RV134_270305 [Roseovarius sp. EC-HK134]VVT16393.1 hypothetical protein RV420_330031 [Roseovarius sp. EC-SD190]